MKWDREDDNFISSIFTKKKNDDTDKMILNLKNFNKFSDCSLLQTRTYWIYLRIDSRKLLFSIGRFSACIK